MPYFFGLYIKSKEEKEQEYQNYVKSIFPYGEKQKSAIESLLKQLVPDENQTFLLLYFIQLRERITADPSLSPFTADSALPRQAQRPKSLLNRAKILALLEADLQTDDTLSYPSIQDLTERAAALNVFCK